MIGQDNTKLHQNNALTLFLPVACFMQNDGSSFVAADKPAVDLCPNLFIS
jgi:hypothetical protein